jgi:hypothetical protein
VAVIGHLEPLLLHGGATVKALSVAFPADVERHWRVHGGKVLEQRVGPEGRKLFERFLNVSRPRAVWPCFIPADPMPGRRCAPFNSPTTENGAWSSPSCVNRSPQGQFIHSACSRMLRPPVVARRAFRMLFTRPPAWNAFLGATTTEIEAIGASVSLPT